MTRASREKNRISAAGVSQTIEARMSIIADAIPIPE